MANPVGKPRRTLDSLKEGWQDDVLREMSEGASLDEIKVMLDVSNELHTRWMRDESEYQETIKKGIELCKAWWQRQGRTNLKDKSFSSTLWYMNMKNRFGWRDNVDHTTQGRALPTPILGGIAKDVPVDDSNSQDSETQQEN